MAIGNSSLPHFDANEDFSSYELAQTVINGLELAGACVIRGLYSEEIMAKLDSEIDPYLTNDNNLTYFQKHVVTATGLATKSKTYALQVVANPLWVAVRDYFLTYESGSFWVGENQTSHKTSAQLGSATALELLPGAEAQGLHRDDLVHMGFNSAATEYHLGRDRCLTFFAASHNTHRGNGATRIVPGSHLWDYSKPPPGVQGGTGEVLDAELSRGDALIILGSVIHGGGANTTDNERRRLYTCGASCSYLRQPENQYLANDVSKVLQLPVEIQKFIGYTPFPPGVGLVNWADPLLAISTGAQLQESENNQLR